MQQKDSPLPFTKLLTFDQLTKEICARHVYAQQCFRKEYLAARLIQKVFRGWRTRKRIRFLNECATIIQRNYRGYVARKAYSALLEATVQRMYTQFYNRQAVIIQTRFRGWQSRRLHFDYYRMRSWLRLIVLKNEELEQETWDYFFKERNRKLEEINAMAKKLCIFIARKLHHLLRTHHRAGIYSNLKSSALTNVERLLASFTFVRFNRDMRSMRIVQKGKFVAAIDKLYERTMECKTKYSRCQEHYRSRQIDQFEEQMAPKEVDERGAGPAMKCPPIDRPYVKSMLATETYCADLIEMMRDFDILSPGRDFSLNTNIVRKPERIEQFIEVLQNFCLLHNLIEK